METSAQRTRNHNFFIIANPAFFSNVASSTLVSTLLLDEHSLAHLSKIPDFLWRQDANRLGPIVLDGQSDSVELLTNEDDLLHVFFPFFLKQP